MDVKAESYSSVSGGSTSVEEEESTVEEVKRGPWTVDEDLLLVNYIAIHGEGRWNSLARSAGLKRTGKSCRLRWLNYLRPDVRRGNITLEEQLTILQLHSQWGNRWSKIAQHLPGRTDNEIKNYWRTRVQKQAKQLGCSVNSKLFRDTMRYVWMPRLTERIQAATSSTTTSMAGSNDSSSNNNNNNTNTNSAAPENNITNFMPGSSCNDSDNTSSGMAIPFNNQQSAMQEQSQFNCNYKFCSSLTGPQATIANFSDCVPSPNGYYNQNGIGMGSETSFSFDQSLWFGNDGFWDNLWDVDVDQDIWLPN